MSALLVLAWLAAALALFTLVLTSLNALTWPRGAPSAGTDGSARSVSVLIPARDERHTIEAAVRSAISAGADEVIVCDDGSTDGTSEILAHLASELEPLHVIDGASLPAGWVGKPHACAQLGEAARSESFLFVDADVELQAGSLERIESLHRRFDAAIVTAVPRQRFGSWLERLVMPLLHVVYTNWLPLPLVWRSDDPRFLAANGQLLSIRRDTYRRIGGFASVRDQIVDDMALCRLAKRRGSTVVFADGHELASCRMYTSAPEVWRGFSKNIYEGLANSLGATAGVFALFATTYLAPYAMLILGATHDSALLAPAVVGVGANLCMRLLLAFRHGHPLSSVVAHPVAIAALLAIAVNSIRWTLLDELEWAGRRYQRLERRGQAAGRPPMNNRGGGPSEGHEATDRRQKANDSAVLTARGST